MKSLTQKQYGYTLVELLIALALSIIIIAPLSSALNESLLVKRNVSAMNDLQQQSRFALSKLDNLISKDFILIESISPSEIRGQSIYETSLAGAYRAVTIKVCSGNLIYSVSGICSNADNQILANYVTGFSVQNLRTTKSSLYERDLIGFNLKLQETNGPNTVDATAKFILGGV